MLFSGDCSTVRQPRIVELSSGECDAYVEFCQRDARTLYHRVLERMAGLIGNIHISCYATGMRRFAAHRAC